MSTSILSRTISSILDKKLLLANSQWAATLSIGTSWTRIRIGWRWAAQDSGGNLGTTRSFAGVMASPASGLTNGPLGTSTSHFVGHIRVNTSVRSTSPIIKWQITSLIGKRVGSTDTTTTPSTTATQLSGVPDSVRTVHIVEIQKGSPNFTIRQIIANGTNALVDVSLAGLKSVLDFDPFTSLDAQLDAVIGGSGTRYLDSSATVAVDEGTDGALNAVVVAWPYNNAMEFSEALFVKME